ncbi:calcium/sodium antiporter [Oleispira antarctica]|uniref:Calcium/sodium antiporter n=1 Tax=Oleispira antarctica TaxID=188908 RepID=A0A1Y5HVJ5_OLEAN|nr:calcium/sodium antiporter [Oleispira antarctica]
MTLTALAPAIAALLAGLVILVWSADRFVHGAAATARFMGISPLVIGLTIVSLGTSAPEMFVSTMAALDGAGGLAVGNAIGSNIANIALVLGITALVAAIPIQKKLIKKEIPILLLVTIIAGLVLADLKLDLFDALILIIALIVAVYLLFQQTSESGEAIIDEDEQAEIDAMPKKNAIFWLVAGLIALMVSSKMLVWGATSIAHAFGISDLIIGLTIVAIGTSLPELAASVASALKGHHDIAIGNIIGSNIFNLLAVLPIPGIIAPLVIDSAVIERDYMTMLGLTIGLVFIIALSYRRGTIPRFTGIILLAAYVAYMALLYSQSI